LTALPLLVQSSIVFISTVGTLATMHTTGRQVAAGEYMLVSLLVLAVVLFTTHCQPEHKVDNDCCKQGNGKDGRAQSVVEAALTP
jgi:hypothetical protein